MFFFKKLKLRFDIIFKPNYIDKVLGSGLIKQLVRFRFLAQMGLEELHYIQSKRFEWSTKMNQESIDLTKKLNEYGYDSLDDYFDPDNIRNDNQVEREFLTNSGIISRLIEIRQDMLHDQDVLQLEDEITAHKKVIDDIDKLLKPITMRSEKIIGYSDIIKKSVELECYYLFDMESVIDIEKILSEHYYQ